MSAPRPLPVASGLWILLRVRALILLASLACAACPAAEPDEGDFLETRYARYRSDQPLAPCGGLAQETDTRVEHLYDLLEEPPPSSPFIDYEWVADSSLLRTCSENAAGCAGLRDGEIAIESIFLAHPHELAHAVHLHALGNSHPLLIEGFASYITFDPGTTDPQDAEEFSQVIEDIIAAGDVEGPLYTTAARFVGMTIERHGLAAFKAFWREIPRNATLEQFRAAYEAQFAETWADGLAGAATREQTFYDDLGCAGDVTPVGDGLHLTIEDTCEDAQVTGPSLAAGIAAGVRPIPVELAADGFYRFRFVHPGAPDATAAGFRRCHPDGPGPVSPLNLFRPQDDVTILLGAGRYLLNLRVPLAPGEAPPIEVFIEPTDAPGL
jgi:hypothetical protein